MKKEVDSSNGTMVIVKKTGIWRSSYKEVDKDGIQWALERYQPAGQHDGLQKAGWVKNG